MLVLVRIAHIIAWKKSPADSGPIGPSVWAKFQLPNLSAHSRLRTVHIHGLALQNAVENASELGIPAQPPHDHGVWSEVIAMLASASSSLCQIYLHATSEKLSARKGGDWKLKTRH